MDRRGTKRVGWTVVAAAFVGIGAGSSLARGQCVEGWQPGTDSGVSWTGVNGVVNAAVVWDPDGAGPLLPRVVIGGQFTVAGDTSVTNLAQWDGTRWLGMGSPNAAVYAVCEHGGSLYCGGAFTSIDGVGIRRVARWDGSAWGVVNGSAGTLNGVNSTVLSLASLGGKLYVGGFFDSAWTTSGTQTRRGIAAYTGTTFDAVGAGVDSTSPFSFAVRALYPDTSTGVLHVGGDFQRANGVASQGYAQWNSGTSTWTAGPGFNGGVYAITKHGGRIVVGGEFTSHTNGLFPAAGVVELNGSTFLNYGSGITGGFPARVRALASVNGYLYAGGTFTTAGVQSARCVARWPGAAQAGNLWEECAGGLTNATENVNVLVGHQGTVLAGGNFNGIGGIGATNLARLDAGGWRYVRPLVAGPVMTLLSNGTGVYAGGLFNYTIGGTTTTNVLGVSETGGAGFVQDGSGFHGTNGVVNTLGFRQTNPVALPALILGGSFTTAGGLSASRVASLALFSWGTFGTGANNTVYAQRATGTSASSPFYLAGAFTTMNGVSANRIARLQSGTWSGLGTGLNNPAYALAMYNGQLHVGGAFTTANGVSTGGIARWDGTTFQALGGAFAGTVHAMAVFENKLVVGGVFPGTGGSPNVSMWNGASWQGMGAGLGDGTYGVNVLAVYNGVLYAGGNFGWAPNGIRHLRSGWATTGRRRRGGWTTRCSA